MDIYVALSLALAFLGLWIREATNSHSNSVALKNHYHSFMDTLREEKDLQLDILHAQTKDQLFILQRENEILRTENLDLLNRVKAADLLTYQHLSKLTSNVPETYVPRDDESEYSKWREHVAQAGMGEPGMEDIGDSNAYAELVELGIVTEPEESDAIFGPEVEQGR